MPILKDKSVKFDGLCPEMAFALGVVHETYSRFGFSAVITSLLDGAHNPGSLHSKGRAADIRTMGVPPDTVKLILSELQRALDPFGFDVVLEGVKSTAATTAPHVHVEFDPKPGESFWKYIA